MIIPTKTPTYWSAAHSPVNFEFKYETRGITAINDNGLGNALIINDTVFTVGAINGDFIYIDSGIYKGYHKVIGGFSTFALVIDAPYIGAQTAGNVSIVKTATFRIYKGFEAGELYDMDTPLPYEFVAEFTPEPNTVGRLAFDISGYLQSFFNPNNYGDLYKLSIGTKQYLTGLFNSFRLVEVVNNPTPETENLIFKGMVLQSGARVEELNQLYFNTNSDIAQEIPPIIFSNCNTDLSELNSFGIYIKRYTAGVLSTDNIVFSSDFNNNFQH